MENVRKQLLSAFDGLPEHRRAEVLDFAEFIRAREVGKQPLDPKKDPLLTYIGGASHGRLAQDIDRELYGT